ncbi:Dyp-type peroxidase domain-containing protein [Cohnella suwonensis]|uniref:Dyp-type peroxidase domain-containing protein n=1 Tax=Cohnella suwonensis TaxID=696072 RepID=A0ABW0M1Q6_9BACL
MPNLQEGIYYASGMKPGKFFAVLFLSTVKGTNAVKAGEALGRLWKLYENLKKGIVPDLSGETVPDGSMTVMAGYGPKAFELAGCRRSIPSALRSFGRFAAPLSKGGGPILQGSGLSFRHRTSRNAGDEPFVFQFIADTPLAVHRAVVETWKLLEDWKRQKGHSTLKMGRCYSGFQRDDRRSWIDFHDGISNMKSEQRYDAIAVKPAGYSEEQWTEGGTYMTFMRIHTDLSKWRKLSRQQQEIIIGRAKLSGYPLVAVDPSGNPIVQAGCPFTSKRITDPGQQAYFEPPNVSDSSAMRHSHVQLANHHLQPISDPSSLRIYRQGYEFFDEVTAPPYFEVGLNFVSFQDTPERVFKLLTQGSWLGGTNLGGDPAQAIPGSESLLSVEAAGSYLVPPLRADEVFPGSTELLQ